MSQQGPMADEVADAASTSRRAKVFVIGVVVVLLVLAIAVVPHFLSHAPTSNNNDQPQLATAAVETFPVAATANGTVVPGSEVGVNFGSAGQLGAVDVQVGQHVNAGTVLAQLNSSVAQLNVAHAQSALASAQSVYTQTVSTNQLTVANAMTVVDSDMQQLTADQQRLVTDDCSTSEPSNALVCQDDEAAVVADQSQLRNDEARAESDKTSGQLSNSQAEAGVTSATTDLQTAQDQLTNLTLTAPIAGTVLQVNGQIGQTVSGTSTGSSTLPGTTAPIPAVAGSGGTQGKQPFILIGNTIAFIVGAAFPATDIPELAPGQSGTITDVSLHGLSLPCHVFAVAQATVMLNGASVVYATLMPVGFPKGLYSGQEVSVSIAVSQATRVLAVPQSAVFLESGIPHVDVWRDHRSVATVVGTGLEGRSLIQITSGLSRGQQVVLSAYQGLSEGATPVVGSQ